jgi:hypothetical protein
LGGVFKDEPRLVGLERLAGKVAKRVDLAWRGRDGPGDTHLAHGPFDALPSVALKKHCSIVDLRPKSLFTKFHNKLGMLRGNSSLFGGSSGFNLQGAPAK